MRLVRVVVLVVADGGKHVGVRFDDQLYAYLSLKYLVSLGNGIGYRGRTDDIRR